ncbi:YjfK family protein [Teredinibacter turnerae]|uniref:YjfK family protein n=1 Tax=Teredinibacter turnerae TaxID=2426 RepID=UPI00035EA774|nr:YjfK family protein [Teredinibacter turnerae]
MFNLFKKKESKPQGPVSPEVMGLRLGCSFELDALHLKLLDPHLVTERINPSQVIEAVGRVDLDDTTILRFYTDDEAFLQVVVQGTLEEDNVIDVKLFHFYDTMDVSSQSEWDQLLKQKIGVPNYELQGHAYARVWQSASEYHAPVAMTEKTFAENGTVSRTDQFMMLFERHVDADNTESLLLSAEEVIDEHNNVSRCLVISTGIVVAPSQITIHG